MSELDKKNLYAVQVDWDDLENKIKAHRRKRMKMALIAVGIVIAILILMFIYRRFRTFTDYKVVSTIEHTDTEATKFTTYEDYVVKYSNDGVSLTDKNNETIWTQAFEMQDPIVSVRKTYIAFADHGGKVVYLMNRTGYQSKITTDMPISKIDVSDKGNIAILMQESDVSYLEIYDINGKKLAEGAIHFENGGYPLDIALSTDGEKLAVAIYNVGEGSGGTTINFYNFDSGDDSTDNLEASDSYTGTVIPRIRYVDDEELIAFGDDKILIYDGDNPKVSKTIEIKDKIKSIFYNDKYFGLLYTQSADAEGESVQVYHLDGDLKKEFEIEGNYTSAGLMNNGELYFLNDNKCAIYQLNGHEKFKGTADTKMYAIMSTNHYRKYIFIRDGKTELVNFKTF